MKQVIITIGTILFTTFLYGQGGVGINNSGNAPNTSAMLDVASTNKGLLIPRVSLTSTTDITTITNGNVTSLLVYNSATIADVVPGYYYWDGTVWKTIGGNDADADPTNEIQDLQLVGNNLTITNNGTPTTIDLSAYLDNTDDQNIDSVILNGNNLTVYIEDGNSSAVDLTTLITPAYNHDEWKDSDTLGGGFTTNFIYAHQAKSFGNNVVISDSGFLGLGIIQPTTLLDLYNPTSTGIEKKLAQFGTDNGTLVSLIQLLGDGTQNWIRSQNENLNLGSNFSPESVTIANAGNVGISTTIPNSKLHIHGGSMGNTIIRDLTIERYGNSQPNRGVGIEFRTGTAGTNSQISGAIEVSRYDTGQGTKMAFLTTDDGGTENINMLISDVGNVGIGTTTPTENLDVNQVARIRIGIKIDPSTFDGTAHLNDGYIGTGSGDAPHISFHNESSPNAAYRGDIRVMAQEGSGSNSWGDVVLGANGSGPAQKDYLTVKGNNGNVGIGTTTPTNKLDINGDLRIQTITPGSGVDVALVADATGVVKQVAPNPVGEIIIFPVITPPTGYLICDGSAVSRTTYSDLFAVLGTSYGPGDGSTTFNLPDLRGEFVRGWDNGTGNDPDAATRTDRGDGTTGDNVGTKQIDAFQDHVHTFQKSFIDGTVNYSIRSGSGGDAGGTHALDGTYTPTALGGVARLSSETRPRNVAMNYCIRF